MVKWDLMDGVKLVQAIQQDCRAFGYHVALGGGVLNNGVGRKDVDLYFLPLKDGRQGAEAKKLLTWLTGLWGPSESIASYGSAERELPTGTFIPDETAPLPVTSSGDDIYFSETIPSTYANITRSTTPSWRTRVAGSSASSLFAYEPVLFSSGSLASLIDNARPSIPEPSVGTVYQYKEKFLRKTSKDRIDVFIV